MLKVVGGAIGAYALINALLWLFGFIVLTSPITVPIGYLTRGMSEGTMTIEAVSVQWSGEHGKSMTLKVTNTSGEPMERFMVSCLSNTANNWINLTDMSGILPGQTEVRTYAIPEINNPTTVTSVSECVVKNHFRGKPSAYNAGSAEQYGESFGGWGDRIPSEAGMGASSQSQSLTDAPVYPGDLDPNIDYD